MRMRRESEPECEYGTPSTTQRGLVACPVLFCGVLLAVRTCFFLLINLSYIKIIIGNTELNKGIFLITPSFQYGEASIKLGDKFTVDL